MKRTLILLSAVLAIVACGPRRASASAPEQAPETQEPSSKGEVGDMFIDFTIQQDPDNPGSVSSLSDYVGQGKYILVDFWASWCGPCRREMPNIKSVWEKYHGDKFDVLSIAVWDNPSDSALAAEELGICWNQIVNAQKVPTTLYGIESIPTLILFAPDGKIVARGIRGPEIGETVAACLAQ